MANQRGGGPQPESDLVEFLKILGEQRDETWKEEQKRIVRAVEADPDAREALGQLTNAGILLERLIELWNLRLHLSLRLDTPPERILCGFNAIADVVYQLNQTELEQFSKWVLDEYGKNEKKKMCDEARRKVQEWSGQVTNRFEMLVTLKQAFDRPGEAWKPVLAQGLGSQVQIYVYHRPAHDFRMGGASGNMAYVLDALGLDTTVHWPYHPREIAADAGGLKRLILERDQKIERPAAEVGTYSTGAGRSPEDPCRRSFVFGFTKGLELCGQHAKGDGRVIFLVPQYLSSKKRPWSRVVLRTTAPTGAKQDCEIEPSYLVPFGTKAWPFFPLFWSKRVEDKKLIVEIAHDNPMEKIAKQFDYFMLGGIQAIAYAPHDADTVVQGRASEPTVRTIVKHALSRQLDILSENGVVIHWEIGGINSPKMLDDLREVTSGKVKSAGLNHTELFTMTGNDKFRQSNYFFHPPRGQPGILTRLDRAAHLARQLNLDELYVHGNDVDLIVRRRTTRGALRQELSATLFAKGVVLLALLKRSVPNWKDHIRNAEVPPVLKAEGFIRLLELAKALAHRHFPDDDPLERRTFLDIVRSGYFYERNPDDYSTIVVPVMWPELTIPFSTAGAGDTTSCVVAVYSGK